MSPLAVDQVVFTMVALVGPLMMDMAGSSWLQLQKVNFIFQNLYILEYFVALRRSQM